MKSQPTRLTLLAVFLVLVQGCASTPNTISNAAPDADFGRYSSFGFLDVLSTDKESYESMESNFLKVAVAKELDRRGLTYSETPDLLVNFYIHTQDKVRSRNVPTTGAYYGYRDPFYDPWGGYGIGVTYETRIDQFTEGTLNIDVVDAAMKKLVWEGAVSGRITQRDIQNLEATIDEAVAAVMASFPIEPVR
jgi:hypothetical protein